MPEGNPVPDPWEDSEAEDCTPWLIEYVRVRLAEHAPDILEALPPDALIYLIPLTLTGLSEAPNRGRFHTYITFSEEDSSSTGT